MKSISIFFLILILFTGKVFSQKKIAYCSNQTSSGFIQVFVMNEDGSDKKQLTDINENCMRPKWSPDGKQIVFYSDRGFIYLIRDFMKAPEQKAYLVWNGYNPSFMPGGDQIMFNSEYEDVLSIFVIDTVGDGAQPDLVSDGSYSNMQMLSADGDKLVFSAFVDGTKSIMLADLNDTTDNYISKVSVNTEANLEPDIFDEGSKIVYSSFDNNLKGTIRIFENGKETAISKGLPSSNVPRFSPDGKKIAFVVIDGTNVSLYTMNNDGSGRSNVGVKGSVGTFQWIDNKRILFDSGSDTRTDVGIADIGGGSDVIIADGGFNLQASIQK